MSLPVIPEERQDDLHNLHALPDADLILFMAGNQFMLMPELVASFQKDYPEVENVFYETLPPGLELMQIFAGGAIFRGREYRIRADIYSAVSKEAMHDLAQAGYIEKDDFFVYLHNKLALMVAEGNPKRIFGVRDLAREDVVVSQPSQRYEHIADHVYEMYRQAGGEDLVQTVLEEKLASSKTLMTTVHHRQTPQRILNGVADAGPVWQTEIIQAKRAGLKVQGVDVGLDLDQKKQVNYYIARLRSSSNPENAQNFLNFITSPTAREIFEKYGFDADT